MAQPDPSGSVTGFGTLWGEGKEKGARRKKVYGYLKAANELRQNYQSQWTQRNVDADEDQSVPGAFPNVEVVRNGDEEMVLFPSYARRHVKQKSESRTFPGARENISNPPSSSDADYWRREWEKFEDENAIVDVDVRGWIYSPQRGPMTRKNRLIVAVARRVSGIPAPAPTPGHSRPSSRHSINHEKFEDTSTKLEDDAASKEAQKIIQRGEGEASAAEHGDYSEEPSLETRDDSPFSNRTASPDTLPSPGHVRRAQTDSTLTSDSDDSSVIRKRRSLIPPEKMSREELYIANDHLMTRLSPFMSTPLTSLPITVFFFNDKQSQSRTVHTNDSGHFNVRASLNFVPTHVRVLASENLSATEEVRITDPFGVSLISDIDDTIKHSAISSGAKEIFRNTFIRDLSDLTVEGVKEWYTKLYNMGVKLHYVSNSPWQLYPLLRTYFGLAGLPPGSMHLKAYTGMLQGIFEPAAERKRGSLERIMRDFPERKFILVGDSGEADLEVYTDTVLENPGRVLAIFIRDVTSQDHNTILPDARFERLSPERVSTKRPSDTPSVKSVRSDVAEERPALPNRPARPNPEPDRPKQVTGNLIDLDEEPEHKEVLKSTAMTDLAELNGGKKKPPNRPTKPLNLRGSPSPSKELTASTQATPNGQTSNKKIPPPPPKPRRQAAERSVTEGSLHRSDGQASTSKQVPHSSNASVQPEGQGFAVTAGKQLAASKPTTSSAKARPPKTSSTEPAPANTTPAIRPAPLRRGLSAYPAAAAQYASNRLTWTSGGNQPPSPGLGPQQPAYNKKEEMWRRRWARAEDILRRERVVLRSWRVGTDVMDESVRLVEKTMKTMGMGDDGSDQRTTNGRR